MVRIIRTHRRHRRLRHKKIDSGYDDDRAIGRRRIYYSGGLTRRVIRFIMIRQWFLRENVSRTAAGKVLWKY